jgi:hypothetical protein
VKVLNKKIDVLSCGNIKVFLHLIESPRGVFQFTQERVLKRIFFASLRLFWFANICGYRGTSGCVIARES